MPWTLGTAPPATNLQPLFTRPPCAVEVCEPQRLKPPRLHGNVMDLPATLLATTYCRARKVHIYPDVQVTFREVRMGAIQPRPSSPASNYAGRKGTTAFAVRRQPLEIKPSFVPNNCIPCVLNHRPQSQRCPTACDKALQPRSAASLPRGCCPPRGSGRSWCGCACCSRRRCRHRSR